MKRQIITTADGSKTIQIEDWNEQYHSVHGAIQEAEYVYINQGFNFFLSHFGKTTTPISILEMGFGTGLNAFLALLEAEKYAQLLHYVGVEAYPITESEITKLNYTELLKSENFNKKFNELHSCTWEENQHISTYFQLKKRQEKFQDIADVNTYDLIYFDAFGARVQPELWTETIFRNMFHALKESGVLVTYSAKGSVRRAMQAVGFTVERLSGPPGKRHMLRAIK